MRINSATAVIQSGSTHDRWSNQTPATAQVERFELRTGDVPDPRASALSTQRQALVAEGLEVGQGDTGACGPLALWLVLAHFGRATQDWRQLDDELRPWAFGTSPGTLIDGARCRGLQAQLYNHGAFADLLRETQGGRGVLVMTDVGDDDGPQGDLQPGKQSDFDSHWMRVTRAWEDSARRRWVEYENPWGAREVLRFEQFDRLWANQRLGGIPTGYDRTYLLVDRPKAKPLPPTNALDVAAIAASADGAQDFVRGVDALSRGRWGEGVGRVVAGLVSAILGTVGTAIALPGEVLLRASDAALRSAERGLQCGGADALGGLVAGAAGVVLGGVGHGANALGNALGVVGQATSALIRGALGGLTRTFG